MKNLAFIAAALCTVLFLANCSEIVTDPEPNPNTYTWKGTLYKAYGNEVWPNAALTLTASERQLSGYTYKTIASGYTDENGYFEIQYDEFDPTPDDGEDLLLEANGLSIKYAPYNVNVDRDFCGIDNHKFVCDISLLKSQGIDSLFILVGEMLSTPGTSTYRGYRIKKMAINDTIADEVVVYSGLSTYWDNSPLNFLDLRYGFSKKDFDMTFDDAQHNFIDVNSKGFPFTNYVQIPAP